jgi:hypothetical protein
LNIEKILEGWEVKHAIREVIANALDEQVLSNTQDITISADGLGNWHIRDFGRGIRYENLTQNENPEKLKNAGKVIGKFGGGLKDALSTLNRRSILVHIRSAHCDISLVKAAKYGFEDVITLQAAVSPASSPKIASSDDSRVRVFYVYKSDKGRRSEESTFERQGDNHRRGTCLRAGCRRKCALHNRN